MTNTNKLKGKIVENGYTLTSFSKAMALSRASLCKKIDGKIDFKASEIEKTCVLLGIAYSEVGDYFFTA